MHEGCSGKFESGKQIVDKLRMMGFEKQAMPLPVQIDCECSESFIMETFESKCPHCGMVYGVTPCHAFDKNNIMAAGKDY